MVLLREVLVCKAVLRWAEVVVAFSGEVLECKAALRQVAWVRMAVVLRQVASVCTVVVL